MTQVSQAQEDGTETDGSAGAAQVNESGTNEFETLGTEEAQDAEAEPKPKKKPKAERASKPAQKRWNRQISFDVLRYTLARSTKVDKHANGTQDVSRDTSNAFSTVYNSNFSVLFSTDSWSLRFGRDFDQTQNTSMGVGRKWGEHEIGATFNYSLTSASNQNNGIETKLERSTFQLGPHYIRRMKLGKERFEPEAHVGFARSFNKNTIDDLLSSKTIAWGYYFAFGADYLTPMTILKTDKLYYVLGFNYSYENTSQRDLEENVTTKRHAFMWRVLGFRAQF
jgi:hypothetical protein